MEALNKSKKRKGLIVFTLWTVAMVFLFTYCLDRIFNFNFLSFEGAVISGLAFIIVIQLIVLNWVLYLRNKTADNNEKLANAINNLYKRLSNES